MLDWRDTGARPGWARPPAPLDPPQPLAARATAVDPAPNAFQAGINSVSWLLIRFAAVMVPIVLVVNGVTKGDWLEAFLFALSVAVGLMLGSFFEKQQDIFGWITVLLLLLVGAMLVKILSMELPAWVESILPWVPSVALAEICRAAFAEVFPAQEVWTNLAIVLVVSLPLYGLVIWKVRRSDR